MATRHFGVTGTQDGANSRQLAELATIFGKLLNLGFVFQHNGDCVGLDEQAGKAWEAAGGAIWLHPPTISAKRAYLPAAHSAAPLPYLDRNKVIVTSSEVMIGVPATEDEVLRSGTWATIRHARRLQKPLLIIHPSGRITRSNLKISKAQT